MGVIASFIMGFLEAAGEWLFRHMPSLTRGYSKKRNGFNSGRIYQEVQDLRRNLRVVEKKQVLQEKRLTKCQIERAECAANYRNVLKMVKKLELKVG